MSKIVTDSSVLINFLVIDRVDLLNKYQGKFFITDHVLGEITNHYPEQIACYNRSVKNNFLEETPIKVDQPKELELFGKLIKDGRLGIGECSAITCAINRNYKLAIDDIRAIKQSKQYSSVLEIVTTQKILEKLVNDSILAKEEANLILEEWRQKYRFNLKLQF